MCAHHDLCHSGAASEASACRVERTLQTTVRDVSLCPACLQALKGAPVRALVVAALPASRASATRTRRTLCSISAAPSAERSALADAATWATTAAPTPHVTSPVSPVETLTWSMGHCMQPA